MRELEAYRPTCLGVTRSALSTHLHLIAIPMSAWQHVIAGKQGCLRVSDDRSSRSVGFVTESAATLVTSSV